MRTLEAEARISAAEELIEIGRRDEGEEPSSRRRSPSTARSGATFFVQRGEALLAQAATG